MIPVPREMISALAPDGDEGRIRAMVDCIVPFFRETVMLMKGGYDLKRCIETLEDYIQTTGITSDHTVDGPVHCFTVRHCMGHAWSVFIRIMLGRLLSEFVPDRKMEYDESANMISVRVSLGSDWDEHDY